MKSRNRKKDLQKDYHNISLGRRLQRVDLTH